MIKKKKESASFGVIGLGRFGTALAITLAQAGKEVIAVDRDENGFAQITRVKVSQELINEGQPLSRLWINGRLGGVPTLI